jgi:hypothetical protein
LSLSDTARTAIREGLQATPATSILVAKSQGVAFTAADLSTYLAITLLLCQLVWFFWSNIIRPRLQRGANGEAGQ